MIYIKNIVFKYYQITLEQKFYFITFKNRGYLLLILETALDIEDFGLW